MKQRILACLALAALLLLSRVAEAETTGAQRYVFGISPFLDKAAKDPVYRSVIGFVLEEAPLNSRIGIYDAYHLRTVAEIKVPEARAFQSAKTRASQFTKQFQQLKEFLAASPSQPEKNGLSFTNALRLPQFLDFISENVRPGSGRVSAVVIGSPLYMDEKEPAFSMAGGYFPSDSHLLASPDKSVFGLKDRGESLAGLTLHLAYFGDPWESQLHENKILRFWGLYLERQGAELGAFEGDLKTVMAAASPKAAARPRREFALDGAQTKMEMLRITRDVDATNWITRELGRGRELPPPSRTVAPMKIGIRWQGDLDLDLYAAPAGGSETLYFENTRSAEGYYYKDHRSSPEREFEFIEFESPVDVWQARARVNFYEGRAQAPPGGEVRIEFDGRIYTGDFAFAASSGNRGREGRGQAAHWVELDIPQILKLRP